jgi:hypothetical protein
MEITQVEKPSSNQVLELVKNMTKEQISVLSSLLSPKSKKKLVKKNSKPSSKN